MGNQHAASTAHAYLRSRYCLVPAGDTPSTRRIFESLAAGCIPIVFGGIDHIAIDLPFRTSVDWTKLAIFAGSVDCALNEKAATIRWLRSILTAGDMHEAERRQLAQMTFSSFFDIDGSPIVIDALLCELNADCYRGQVSFTGNERYNSRIS